MPTPKDKYRVSVSQQELEWLVSCEATPEDLKRLAKVALLKVKSSLLSPTQRSNAPAVITRESIFYAVQAKLAAGEPVNPHEHYTYLSYGYENELLTPEESAAFEKTLLTGM